MWGQETSTPVTGGALAFIALSIRLDLARQLLAESLVSKCRQSRLCSVPNHVARRFQG